MEAGCPKEEQIYIYIEDKSCYGKQKKRKIFKSITGEKD
jgi:hypothetical protein